jgi:hypothetical protein
VSKVVERTFELWNRRRPGKGLVFIIDEVGQHVARSGDKIEDLRATIEEFGKVGKNLLKARKITTPAWIVVTSQEKLDEVVAAIDSKRVELAKLQDRFRNRVDLAPSDIREVATRRVLAKKPAAEAPLRELFKKNEGRLNDSLRLERTTRRTDIQEDAFVHFYPYPPHYIDLCIGIMSGIRLQPGAPRHYGGSNRTIIKQAYEMLVSDRTAFARQPVGSLVSLDKVFELVEGNLSNEKRTDLHQISERFQNDAEDRGWALRVAKVICLLEFIRDLPRTESNVAALLVDAVGKPAPVAEVQQAVKRLDAAKFIRNTEEGWKLQTAQEKNWTNERSGHLDPKPREEKEIIRAALQQIFDEPEFKTYRYHNRSFRIGINVDGAGLGDVGELPLTLCVSEDADDLTRRIDEVRTESQQKTHENDLYWLFCLTPEIDELVHQVHASRKMVDKYNQLSAQQKISADESSCLQDEKNLRNSFENRLRDKLTEAMERGTGLFRGVQKDASSLGKGLGEILKKQFGHAMPDLYPKLELGSRPLKGDIKGDRSIFPNPGGFPTTFRQAQRADRSTNRAGDEDELLARWAGERRGRGDLSRPAGPGWGNGWPVGPEVGLGCGGRPCEPGAVHAQQKQHGGSADLCVRPLGRRRKTPAPMGREQIWIGSASVRPYRLSCFTLSASGRREAPSSAPRAPSAPGARRTRCKPARAQCTVVFDPRQAEARTEPRPPGTM